MAFVRHLKVFLWALAEQFSAVGGCSQEAVDAREARRSHTWEAVVARLWTKEGGHRGPWRGSSWPRTKNLDFRGFDSSRNLLLGCGILAAPRAGARRNHGRSSHSVHQGKAPPAKSVIAVQQYRRPGLRMRKHEARFEGSARHRCPYKAVLSAKILHVDGLGSSRILFSEGCDPPTYRQRLALLALPGLPAPWCRDALLQSARHWNLPKKSATPIWYTTKQYDMI